MIQSLLVVTPIEQIDSYTFKLDNYIFNEWFIVGCFLGAIIVTIILLMANNSRSNYIDLTDDTADEPSNNRYIITHKLVAQLGHNNENPRQPLNYKDFPSNHPGYLNLEQRIRLVSIIRSSIMADEFRFGSSLGTFYIKNTYKKPFATPEMIGVVIHGESISN